MQSKLPHIGTTIFTQMSMLAAEQNAVNLGQGFPGFSIDMHLGELVSKYIRKGYNQYAPMQGVSELRQNISTKIENAYGHRYDHNDEITITAGGTQAIYTAITALVHEGDEVILFSPAYDCYSPAVELSGGSCVWVELYYPEYRINWENLQKKINHRTRMIIINTPHNPSGTCMTSDDMKQLEKLIAGTDIYVLSDEVYEHIVFDGVQHESIARYPALAAQSMIVFSFGKTFHNTGWKMGYICGPAALMTEFRKVHQFNVFSCNTPVQYALAEYMEDEANYKGLSKFYQEKRDYFLQGIGNSRFAFSPSQGTYFQLLSYEGMYKEKDTDLAIHFTKSHKIASIPCSSFYPDHLDQHVLRFCFAKDEETLSRAVRILSAI